MLAIAGTPQLHTTANSMFQEAHLQLGRRVCCKVGVQRQGDRPHVGAGPKQLQVFDPAAPELASSRAHAGVAKAQHTAGQQYGL